MLLDVGCFCKDDGTQSITAVGSDLVCLHLWLADENGLGGGRCGWADAMVPKRHDGDGIWW